MAEVVPLSRGDLRLTYRIPSALQPLLPGTLVIVPLQRRREKAVVVKLTDVCDFPQNKLLNISGLLSEGSVLPPDLLKLATWMAGYYMAPFRTVVEAMVPAPVREGKGQMRETMIEAIRPVEKETLEALNKAARRQGELLQFLLQQTKAQPRSLVLKRMNMSASVAEGLVEKGLAKCHSESRVRESYQDGLDAEAVTASGPPALTEEQEAAFTRLEEVRKEGGFACWLLHGVTGSGKTEVYLRLMEKTLEEGGQVLFLVPEIALAPQTVARVRSRLVSTGANVVVWHSNLSAGQRADAFREVAEGRANVVVGARSAVFAPFPDLRLVLVDEEHEPAYKQEETPRYHGRDVAIMRAFDRKVMCLLGSATPALETLYNVRAEKFGVVKLTKRVDDRQMPLLHVVDLRRARAAGKGGGLFSPLLRDKMIDRLEKGEQTILFLNRRGYSTTALCPSCGHVVECPHCSVGLTLHRTDNRMRCHLCGYEKEAPTYCPSCRSPDFKWKGSGTQKVEAAVQALLPKARVVRLDADSARKRNHFRSVLQNFRKGKIDVLVGTQMIAKGLDFPNVTLVGLIDADLSLHQEDFRAAERTFQLIVQVSGRSGRGDRAGEVVVQTLTPHAPPIQFARRQDFDGFLDEELSLREEFRYPPYRHLIRQVLQGRNEEKIWFVAEKWAEEAEKTLGADVEIRGPAPTPIEKVADEYRVQLWYFTSAVSSTGQRLARMAQKFELPDGVKMMFDVDAVGLR
ncbi:replication restart helicase PriA [Puniceicoccus vermicola]|uniref:Replication restart protein PriA n=2 Tax=Puniceicoccus vermicola TaxID=388746 RepID=A0A7X1AZT1_9BACT|nr:primosomal protein N' [Puniceicoccus vermicola]MBC2601948.1 primosomal protein N' [Puniceicoccus vermicola]